MPLNLNYLPGIEKKTGKTTKEFVAAAIRQGIADPELKPGVRMAWLKKEYGLGHGHALFMAHTIKNEMLKRAKKKSSSRVTDNRPTRERLIMAAIDVIRAKGYAAASVNDIAAAAGVTKGSFFHHFSTKEACAREAAVHWNKQSKANAAHSSAKADTPSERILAYIDFRISLLAGPIAKYACYVGTVLQEVHDTHPELAADISASLLDQAAALKPDLAVALGASRKEAHGLAVHIEATIQGALLLAKAEGGTKGARASLAHLKNYVELKLQGDKK